MRLQRSRRYVRRRKPIDSQPAPPTGTKEVTYQAHRVVQRETADCKNLADGDDDVAEEEDLHFPITSQPPVFLVVNVVAHLRPTAAFFLSDLQSRKKVVRIAMPHSIMEPAPVSWSPIALTFLFH